MGIFFLLLVLLVLWIVSWLAYQVTSALSHILLVLATIVLIVSPGASTHGTKPQAVTGTRSPAKGLPRAPFHHFGGRGNALFSCNYQSSWTGDIWLPPPPDAKVGCLLSPALPEPALAGENLMDDDINIRILRVTEDLRAIQQELNWSVVDAPDTQKVEAIDLQALQALKSALDQMRHFLWFYIQVITNESEFGEKLRQVLRQRTSGEQISESEASFLERLNFAADAALLRCLADSKNRKPN